MSRLQNYLNMHLNTKLNPAAVAFAASLDCIEASDPAIAASITRELADQRSHLKLIASENYSSFPVQLAMGNWLTDKYAEGYPSHRFYAGCENIDAIEAQAQEEVKKLFMAEHANVQPHSGADANILACWSILVQRVQTPEVEKLGKKNIDELSDTEYERIRQLLVNQKILGMSLNSGGHLTHGYKHNLSSKMMRASHYDVDRETELLDYAKLAAQAKQLQPDILLAGFSAHPRRLNFAKMREIADSVGAVLLVDMAHFAGLVAGKVFTGEFDPIPYAHVVTSTTHKTLRGPRGGFVLSTAEFSEILNKGCPLVLGGPLPHVMAAKALAFKEANTPAFRAYAHQVVDNAKSLAAAFQSKGLRLVTGGTDNHLMIVDLTRFGLTGRQAETALKAARLTVNRNAIPFDQNGPWYTSGIRVGTPATTTLGMGEGEMHEIASMIFDILSHTRPIPAKNGEPSKAQSVTDPATLTNVQARVQGLLHRYPLYPEIVI